MATLKEIASKANVSIRTVRRILNNEPIPSVEMTGRVRETLKVLPYTPNILARGLKIGKTHIIGIIAYGFETEITLKKVNALKELIEESGFIATVGMTSRDATRERNFCMQFPRICDGIIVLSDINSENIDILKNSNVPFLMIDILNNKFGNHVEVDRTTGIFDALGKTTNHYDNFVYLAFKTKMPNIRLDAFCKALNGKKFEILECNVGFESAYHAVRQYKARQKTLFVCHNDRIAAGVLRYLSEKRKRIPEDFGIIGYDDDDFTNYTYPAISTIGHNIEMLAGKTLHKLKLILRKKEAGTPVKLPSVFIPRETTPDFSKEKQKSGNRKIK